MPSRTNDKQEQEATNTMVQRGNKGGRQHGTKTSKIDETGNGATKIVEDGSNKQQGQSKSNKKDAQSCTEHWEDEEHLAQNQEEYKKFQEQSRREAEAQGDVESEDAVVKKRGRGANESVSNKKQKYNSGGKDGEPRGIAGDKNRVPKKGQKVQWKGGAGYVDGEVIEVVYEEKTVEGSEHVKASKEDPRIVLRSESSGKICVHEPEVVYFE